MKKMSNIYMILGKKWDEHIENITPYISDLISLIQKYAIYTYTNFSYK